MRKFTPMLLLLGLLTGQLYAQNSTVKGTVTDDRNGPLQGVSVVVKGAGSGTKTDASGSYSLAVPATGKILLVSFVNFIPQEVTIGGRTNIDIKLLPRPENLQEVVVTALGISRDKRSLGYATQNLKSEDITDRGEPNLVNLLQGKVAGADITGASGSAGASSNINIRGITSFNGDNQPLFVVDGIPVSNNVDRSAATVTDQQPANRALDLNVNDIESVNVLKGPAAAALYGSRAASGAIIITTKKGAGGRGKVKVSLGSSYSQQVVNGWPKLQNTYGQGTGGQYVNPSTSSWGPAFGATPTLSNGLLTAAGQTIPYRAYPDNVQNFFETATTADNNIGINGGDARQNFNFSAANLDQSGILPNTSLNKTNIGVKFNSALSDRLTLGASVNYVYSKQLGIVQGNTQASPFLALVGIPRSFDLGFYKEHYQNPDGTNNWPLSTTRDNPFFSAYKNPLTSSLNRTIASVNLGYDITKWLNIAYRLGVDNYSDRRKRIRAIGSLAFTGGLGSVLEDDFFRSEVNGDLILTGKKDDFFIKHLNANFLVGQNINSKSYQNLSVEGDQLGIPDFYNVSSASSFTNSGETTTRQRLVGYYAQMSFAYNNYLFLELTGRADQSSTLPVNKNTYFYPAVASSFVFTDAFKWSSPILTYGKIRASFAKVGRDAPPYKLQSTYNSYSFGNNVAQFVFPYGTVAGFGSGASISNPALSPEFTTSYEAGMNLAFWRNRVSLDATYFYESSKSQIVEVGIPYSTGWAQQVTNIGEMTNKGVELLLNVTPVQKKNLRWDITANFTRLRNKVVSIGNGTTSFAITGNAFTGEIPSIVEGQPYGVILGNKYQRAPGGELLINPVNGLPFGTVGGQIIADPNRNFIGGITNTIKYKNISLSFLVDYKQGGQIVSWGIIGMRFTGGLDIEGKDRDQPRIFPGVIKTSDGKYITNNIQIPAQTYWQGLGQTSGAGDFGVFDATTLRLRETSLGLDFSGRQLGTKLISNLRLTLFGRNLLYYAPNAPFDPEINTQGAGNIRGLELQSTPSTRSLGASLRLSFN